MDPMPVVEVPVPTPDALKLSAPETNTQHVEHVSLPAVEVEHHEHLPMGISETEEEKKSHWFIGSIDCGTTSSRFLIFNGEGTPIASHQIEFDNIYPESGYASATSPLPRFPPLTALLQVA
jgi:glycerol kinase